jgi:hypothetical protein
MSAARRPRIVAGGAYCHGGRWCRRSSPTRSRSAHVPGTRDGVLRHPHRLRTHDRSGPRAQRLRPGVGAGVRADPRVYQPAALPERVAEPGAKPVCGYCAGRTVRDRSRRASRMTSGARFRARLRTVAHRPYTPRLRMAFKKVVGSGSHRLHFPLFIIRSANFRIRGEGDRGKSRRAAQAT